MVNQLDKKIYNKEWQNKINLFLRRYFGALVFIAVAILIYAGYYYIIKPKNDRGIARSQVMIADKQSEKRMLEGVLEKINAYRLAYDDVNSFEKERLNMILPGVEGKSDIFTNVEAFVLRQGLVLDSIEVSQKNENKSNSRQRQENEGALTGGVQNINLSLELSGINNYDRFKSFLVALENNLRLIDVLSLNYDQEGGTLSLEAVAYYLPVLTKE